MRPEIGGGFQRALVAIDRSAYAPRVLHWLRRLVATGGEIHLLVALAPARASVLDGQSPSGGRRASSERLTALATLGMLAGRLRVDGVSSTGHVRFGESVRTILDTAADVDADVIALTLGDARGWWWPSGEGIVEGVQRRARVPVLIARRATDGGTGAALESLHSPVIIR
jgi:nucleotide-binding universal stress UspA family protein